MNCEHAQLELVGYHFGETDAETLPQLEQHFLACQTCLADFFEVKRSIENKSRNEMPSANFRAALRRAVAAEVGAEEPSRLWRWWQRPAAFAAAGASLAASLVFLHRLATSDGEMPKSLQERPTTTNVQRDAPAR